jgi:diguanylate cyclase (GGDEF)-like protein
VARRASPQRSTGKRRQRKSFAPALGQGYDIVVPNSDSPDFTERTIITERKAAQAVTPAEKAAYVVIIYGADLGKRIPLGAGSIEAGRSTKCDIPIDQESVSRRHARIFWDGSGYRLKDLGSTNGTYVNDLLVTDGALSDGDQIKIGRTILKFMTGSNIEASYHEEIYRMMTFDGLTQIFNKRYFHETLEREISRSRRYGRDLSLILFDIDHFKQKNDTFGHLAGDAILRELASVVRAKLRREDIFARVGGEEFAVLVPEVALKGALEVGEKIRQVVERTTFRFEQHVIPTTVSVGVALWNGGEDRPEDLYKRTDAALYAAKEGGRNRVKQG